MADLYCVPLGQTARNLFYRQIDEHERQESVLVLPNRYLRRQAQLQTDAECIGIDSLANKILNKNGYVGFKEINRRSQELITGELIEYLADRGQFQYFDRLLSKKGFIKAAASLIGQLSRSGATEEQIREALLNWNREGYDGQKDEEIAQLYVLYRQYLKNKDWFDLEGKYRLAVYVLEKEQVQIPWKHIYISDFYSFDVLQLEFLKKLSRHCNLHIGLMYEEGRNQVFSAVQSTYGYLVGFCEIKKYSEDTQQADDLQFIAQNIFREPVPRSSSNISLLEFKAREQEIRWVLTEVKKLLTDGVAAEKILITLRSLDNYNGIRQIADEYGIALSLPHTARLTVQPAAEFLLLFLQAYADNREGTEAYFKLLNSEAGKLIFAADTEAASLLRSKVYYTSRREVQQLCSELYGEDAVLTRVTELLEQLPGKATLSDYIELLQALLNALQLETAAGRLYKEGKLDLLSLKSCLLARQQLGSCLDSLLQDYKECEKHEEQLSLTELLEILQETFNETEITLAQEKSRGVLVTEVVNVQGQQFDYIFVMGLREGEFPSVNSENWIYNDKERAELAALGIEMPNTAQAYAEDIYFFAVASAQCRSRLYYSWFKDDSAGASSYVEELTGLFTDLAVTEISSKEPASVQEVLSLAGCDSQWAEAKIGTQAYQAAFVDGQRQAQGCYNGILTSQPLLQKIREQVGTVFSASRLEVYAACPFRFLGEVIWQESSLAEKAETVEPADEGSMIHEILALFMRRHLREKLVKYPFAELEAELFAVCEEMVVKYAEKTQSSNNVLWQADKERIKNTLHKWLLFEYQEQKLWQEYVPYAVEQDFRNETAPAVKLADGTVVSFRGRIDRVDGNGSKFFITDYKRSSAPSEKDLINGLDLQLPVYLLAAEKMHGAGSVAGGGYLVLKDAERTASAVFAELDTPTIRPARKLLSDSEHPWEDFAAGSRKMLGAYVQNIYDGRFATEPVKSCSEYCPLKNICRIGLLQQQGGDEDNG